MIQRVRLAVGTSRSMKRFWPMMGPYIASREVHKELNDNIFDDGWTVWFVMHTETGREVPTSENVLGFCCARITESKCELKHDYVLPEYRNDRRYSILFDARQKYLKKECPDKPQEIVTNNIKLIQKLRSSGFKPNGVRGSYTIFRREAEENEQRSSKDRHTSDQAI